jgi:excisionase family DNA binding protein
MLDVVWQGVHYDDMATQTICTIPNQRYLGVDAVGEMTGLSPWTWRRWAYDGKIASVKVGRRLLIPATEIERVMREGMRPALEAR